MAEYIPDLCNHKMNRKLFDSPKNENKNNFETLRQEIDSSTESDDNFENYLSKIRHKSPILRPSPTVIVVSDSSDIEINYNDKTPLKTNFIRDKAEQINLESPERVYSPIDGLENSFKSLGIGKVITIDSEDSDTHSDTDIFFTPLSKPILNPNFVTPRSTPLLNTPKLDSSVVKKFNSNRKELGDNWYFIFNETVFSSQLPKDLNIIWNKNLTKTAGYCEYKFDRSAANTTRTISINLSTKIITDENRLKSTLIHEMCHGATWMINGVKEGHGQIWKGWAYKASQVYPDLPPITRCHSFSIDTKFKYKCTNCYYTVGRHSKSIDTTSKCCPLCRSRIELMPLTDKKGNPRKLNIFAEYVKDNYNSLEKSLPHRDKMKCLSESYKDFKLQYTPIQQSDD